CSQSVPPISASQFRLTVPSVPPISASQCAYQCHLSVLPISAICECCLSVPPTSASSSVPISTTYQCPSVPISAASLAHISEGEKSLIYKIL
ncbi:unnamed protein product, partial [Staurois parvus]